MGRVPDHFYSKFVPNPYQYKKPSFRQIDARGIRLRVDISDYIGHYYYFGFKHAAEERLFLLCKTHANVLDIGSNIGTTLLQLAQRAHGGNVIGFEPDPYNYSLCADNLSLNGFCHARVLNLGLGAEDRNHFMEVRSPGNLGGNRISPLHTVADIKVRIAKLDTIFADLEMNGLDLVKIDVEGYELRVLKGGQATLRKFKPVLFIEIDNDNLLDQGDSAVLLFDFLAALGYQSFLNAESLQPVKRDDDFSHCHFDVIAQ